ncbi:MAG: ABC transporter permease [Smithella sp.]
MIRRQLKEIVRKETLIMLRDKQTILLLFLMPLALIFFMTLAFKGVYADKIYEKQIPLVIENECKSPKANLLEQKIQSNKMIKRVDLPPDMDKDRIFENGKAQVLVVIPKGFEEGTSPVELYFDPVFDTGYKVAVRSLMTSLTVEVVMGIDNIEAVVAGLITEKTKRSMMVPSPLQLTVPAYAIFAMFFIAIPMSIGFLKEKTEGTLQRLFTYSVSPSVIALGKIIPYYVINIIQFVLMLFVGVFIAPYLIDTPFHTGTHPWHLIPITLAVAAATTGFGVLIATMAKTLEQTSTLAATGAILMGVLGGIMVPHFVMSPLMQKLAMISPIYWAHQSYLDVFLRDANLNTILPKLAVLLFFALACFLIAGRRVKWM